MRIKYDKGFSLIELVVGLTILGVLATFLLSMTRGAIERVHATTCMARMRSIGAAVLTYTNDHNGNFPRSLHSAGAHRESGWSAGIFPYLTHSSDNVMMAENFNRLLRCPSHKEKDIYTYSYGLNVFFELDPKGDDYQGSPQTWRNPIQVPHPSRTILVAEPRPVRFGDHLMSHLWSTTAAASNALSGKRHSGKSHFLFVDGHVQTMEVKETLDSSKCLNLWNPSLAE